MGWLSNVWEEVQNATEAVATGGLSLLMPDAPSAPATPANPATDPAAIAERDKKTREEALRRLMGGMDSTIATSPMGLASAAPVATKSLLGA